MQENISTFKHESLQDAKSIQDFLKTVTKSIAKGELRFSDEDGEIKLHPDGLLNLKVSAKKGETTHQLQLKISWQVQKKELKKRVLEVS